MAINLGIPKKSRPLWQLLLAPMLLASLGLHALVLMLPSGSSSDAVIPPPDPEQDSVAITRVPPAGQPDEAATPATAPLAAVAPAAVPQAQPSAGAAPVRSAPAPAARPRPAATRPPASSRTTPANGNGVVAPANGTAAAPPPPPAAPPSRPLFDAAMGERLLAYVTGLNLPQAQVDRAAESIQNRFGFNAAAVTREALSSNQRQWEADIRRSTGIADLTPELDRTSFSTVYPQRVCLAEEPGEVRIGALVNPDGSWRSEPVLLRSSGYGALDRKALQEITAHEFAPGDGIRAHILTVSTSVSYGTRPCLDPNPES